MKSLLIHAPAACLAALLSIAPAAAQEPLTDAKRADIMRLIQITGSGQIGLQFGEVMAKAITDNMKTVRPDIPPRVPEIVKEEVVKLLQQRLSGLMELLVPVYHQHFAHDQIKGLLQFYGTPLGKSLIQQMPAVLQESMAAGQSWGQSMSTQIEDRLRLRLAAEGFK